MNKQWVILDDDGEVIRHLDHEVAGAVEVKEPEYKIDWSNYEECLL